MAKVKWIFVKWLTRPVALQTIESYQTEYRTIVMVNQPSIWNGAYLLFAPDRIMLTGKSWKGHSICRHILFDELTELETNNTDGFLQNHFVLMLKDGEELVFWVEPKKVWKTYLLFKRKLR